MAYADDDVVVVIDPTSTGILVAPRAHVTSLSMTAGPAWVLTAIRRAVLHLEEWYQTASAAVDSVTDMPGSVGHVCYRVMPTSNASRGRPPAPVHDELDAQARDLAHRLRTPASSPELFSSK